MGSTNSPSNADHLEELSGLAAKRYTLAELITAATRHGIRRGGLTKRDTAWHLARDGYVDAEGTLLDTFPGVTA